LENNFNIKYIHLIFLLLFACKPLVTTFDDFESAIYYSASNINEAEYKDTLKVMTWNIRFGAARIAWFGDSCGDRVLMSENETILHLESITNFLDTMFHKPDIILLQEVDISSKRTAYLDQVQWLLDHSHFNYGVYASMWQADIIPSDGLGKVNVGNAILSRYQIIDAERIKLPLRSDQEDLTQYFYLRRNILKAKINLQENELYAVNIHATAFATDDTKQQHIDSYLNVLENINSENHIFISGGDLNSLPPNAEQWDYCLTDMCSGENFHNEENGAPHREGSFFNNFENELNILEPLYDNYYSAIPTESRNEQENFTHSPWNEKRLGVDENYWDRKLDYLFTNNSSGYLNGETYQTAHQLSDHAPVSALIVLTSK
tara:strand:- start:2308 stop:3435 length:1128 start_codon:yes stop_codon:yes gene_type:complete